MREKVQMEFIHIGGRRGDHFPVPQETMLP